MSKFSVTLLAVAFAGWLATDTAAQRNAETIMKQFDKNSDNKLSKDEIAKAGPRNKKIAQGDTDSDGFVTFEELKAVLKKAGEDGRNKKHPKDGKEGGRKPGKKLLPETIIKQCDKDEDGKLSMEECGAAGELAEELRKADRDADGFVKLEELKAAWEKAKKPPKKGGKGDKPGKKEGKGRKKSPEGIMKQYDANRDGKLTKEECKGGGRIIETLFKRADTNRDGLVTLDELKKAAKK